MDISDEIKLKVTIKQGVVYYFVHPTMDSTEPHYFVVLNKDPLSDEVILLTCATSQVDKVVSRRKNVSSDTLVILDKKDCDFLSKETIFDCNSLKSCSVDLLVGKLSAGKLKIVGNVTEDVLEKLLDAVLASPLIVERDKGRVK